MQISLPNSNLLERKRHRLATVTLALCLVCFALAQGASQLTNTKRITALQLGESAEGSRVIVTGDSLLDDYEAFRRGDRFYVRIPAADFVAAHPRFQGNGFEDVQVQKVGDSVVISFRLQPGANARVIGAANRLDVIFTSPNFAGNKGATAVRNRVARNSANEKGPSTRSFSKGAADVAGPMPPASPTGPGDYTVSNEGSRLTPRTGRSQHSAPQATAVSTKGAVPLATPVPTTTAVPIATPYPTSSPYETTYSPASATYTPAAVQPPVQPSNSSFDLDSRSRAVWQWVRTNRSVSAGVGVALMGLLGVVLFFVYRRRQSRRAVLAKASRVQPKYSADNELEDMVATNLQSESSKVGPSQYVDQDAYESWGENITSETTFFEDLTPNTRRDVTYDDVVAPPPYDAPSEESWEHFPESNPQAYKSRVQEEREVFEL